MTGPRSPTSHIEAKVEPEGVAALREEVDTLLQEAMWCSLDTGLNSFGQSERDTRRLSLRLGPLKCWARARWWFSRLSCLRRLPPWVQMR